MTDTAVLFCLKVFANKLAVLCVSFLTFFGVSQAVNHCAGTERQCRVEE